jgi:hypothetical protein
MWTKPLPTGLTGAPINGAGAGKENCPSRAGGGTRDERKKAMTIENAAGLLEKESRMVLVDEDKVELDGSDTSSEDTIITEPFDPAKIRVDPKNTTMDVLIKRIKNGEIDLAPEFQRRAGIWNDTAQSRLIESMLIRIPLPAFYMDASNDNNWLVVDGLQRLTAIKRYVIDDDLTLTGLEFLTAYNGQPFQKLPRNFQRRIEETDIVVYLIQPGTPDRVKFDIFRRINTGGEPLSSQEIRHALNQGKITKFLEKLAGSIEFKEATANGVAPKRMDDRECALRFIAFCLYPPETYKSENFDVFLNRAMATANDMSDTQLEALGLRFLRSMRAAARFFGNDAFRKRYDPKAQRHPINKALFEAWSVNLDGLTDEEIEQLSSKKNLIREAFIKEMNSMDGEFDTSITQGTGSVKRVKKRFGTVRSIIREVLS